MVPSAPLKTSFGIIGRKFVILAHVLADDYIGLRRGREHSTEEKIVFPIFETVQVICQGHLSIGCAWPDQVSSLHKEGVAVLFLARRFWRRVMRNQNRKQRKKDSAKLVWDDSVAAIVVHLSALIFVSFRPKSD